MHVKQQRYDINDVDMEKHHHDHKVGAGAHAALMAGQTIAGRPERQGRAPRRRLVLSVGVLLVVRHFWNIKKKRKNQEVDCFVAAKTVEVFKGQSGSGVCTEVVDALSDICGV